MSVGEPDTIWTPPIEGEMSTTGNPNLDTESGLDLLTESSVNLLIEDSAFTILAPTVWAENEGI